MIRKLIYNLYWRYVFRDKFFELDEPEKKENESKDLYYIYSMTHYQSFERYLKRTKHRIQPMISATATDIRPEARLTAADLKGRIAMIDLILEKFKRIFEKYEEQKKIKK